jgi:hypothetical protein
VKLLGCVAEELTDSIISSVNQVHRKEIKNISKKIDEAKNTESKKNFQKFQFSNFFQKCH